MRLGICFLKLNMLKIDIFQSYKRLRVLYKKILYIRSYIALPRLSIQMLKHTDHHIKQLFKFNIHIVVYVRYSLNLTSHSLVSRSRANGFSRLCVELYNTSSSYHSNRCYTSDEGCTNAHSCSSNILARVLTYSLE